MVAGMIVRKDGLIIILLNKSQQRFGLPFLESLPDWQDASADQFWIIAADGDGARFIAGNIDDLLIQRFRMPEIGFIVTFDIQGWPNGNSNIFPRWIDLDDGEIPGRLDLLLPFGQRGFYYGIKLAFFDRYERRLIFFAGIDFDMIILSLRIF